MMAMLGGVNLVTTQVFANEFSYNHASTAAQHLPTIVVTATRSEKLLSESPIRTEVVDAEEIKKTNARSLKDALENVSGLQLREIHGKSGYELSLQGLSSDQVLVLIDGLPLAASTSSTVDLSQYLLSNIERIEVIKGAASAQYGSAAMGGVINIITKKINDGLNLQTQIDIGSYGQQNASGRSFRANDRHAQASIEGGLAQLRGRLTLDKFDSDGFAVEPEQFARQGDQQKREQYTAYAAWNPLQQMQLWAEFNQYQEKDQQRVLNFVPPYYQQQRKTEDIERNRLSAGAHYLSAQGLRSEIKAVHEKYDSRSVLRVGGYDAGNRASSQENNHVSTQFDLPRWNNQLWQLGLDWREESLAQYNQGKAELTSDTIRHQRQEAYLQNDVLFTNKLEAIFGLRYQEDDDFGGHSAAKASLKYQLLDSPDQQLNLRASFGQGYRVPNLKERFYVFDHSQLGYMVLGNPHLRPESSDSYQLGFNLLLGDAWTIESNIFRNNVQDLIQTDFDNTRIINGITQYTYNNVARAQTQGIENTVNWQATDAVRFNAAYTYTQARNQSTGLYITQRPKHIARLGADWQADDQLSLSLRGRYQSDEFADSDNQLKSPAWATVDLNINYDWLNGINTFAGMNNIFDQQRDFSSNHDFGPIFGRYTYLGLRYQWQQ
ncbi:TonB-dependent receptor plug domain-containing protein [Alkanindiges sp. WGS2144]|uniref:TonB-dependent receptor plug domain-containing protein n=1 Tax=Alkanindiges sp. WGS2144 TaxID=3366808 RepID=UPI003751D01B